MCERRGLIAWQARADLSDFIYYIRQSQQGFAGLHSSKHCRAKTQAYVVRLLQ